MRPASPAWLRVSLLVGALGFGGLACRPGAATSSMLNTPKAELGPETDGQCRVDAGGQSPFIVEWTAAERARLESAVKRGVVGVRYTGCHLELLTRCTAPASYEFQGVTPKHDSVEVNTADELFARFPRGAVNLQGTLERAGSLTVDMVVVGRREATAYQFVREDLRGDCAKATHIISGLTVGAFSFHTGAKAKLGASVEVEQVGAASAGSESSRETLSQDGDVAACESFSGDASEPPMGCGAHMQVDLHPLIGRGFEEKQELAELSFLDKKAPWRKKVVYGFAGMGVTAVGMFTLFGGTVMASRAGRDVENLLANEPMNFGDRRSALKRVDTGNALTITGGVIMGAGYVTSMIFIAMAGREWAEAKRDYRKERRERRRASFEVGATGVGVRF